MVETALLNLTCTSDDKVFTYQIVKNTPFVVQDFLLFNPERFEFLLVPSSYFQKDTFYANQYLLQSALYSNFIKTLSCSLIS